MRHRTTSAARLYAAGISCAAEDSGGRDFRVTIIRPGESVETFTRWYANAADANLDALERGGPGAHASVRPFIEQSFDEGEAAFPYELHRDATASARAGWAAAKAEAERRPSYRMALLQQANQITQLQASTL